MARSGGRSEWERRQAAQRQQAERLAREQIRQAKEREKANREAHLVSQQLASDSKTVAVDRQIKALDEILAS